MKIGVDVLMWWLQNQVVDSVLIVTKRALLQNWKDELREHTYIEARVLDQDRAANYRAFNTPARVYLTHYEVLVSERKRLELFLRTRDVGVILDEAHPHQESDDRCIARPSCVADRLQKAPHHDRHSGRESAARPLVPDFLSTAGTRSEPTTRNSRGASI